MQLTQWFEWVWKVEEESLARLRESENDVVRPGSTDLGLFHFPHRKEGDGIMRKGKKKVPTLAELVEQERKCRENLATTADEVYAYALELPPDNANEEQLDCAYGEVEEALEFVHNLIWDAEHWLDASKALAEAMAKQKPKAA